MMQSIVLAALDDTPTVHGCDFHSARNGDKDDDRLDLHLLWNVRTVWRLEGLETIDLHTTHLAFTISKSGQT